MAIPWRLGSSYQYGRVSVTTSATSEASRRSRIVALSWQVRLDLLDEGRPVARGALDGLERFGSGVGVLPDLVPEKLGVAQDRRKEVVEVVRDPHRHLAHDLHAAAARLLQRPRDRLAENFARDQHRVPAGGEAGQAHGVEVQKHRRGHSAALARLDEEHLVRDEVASGGLGHVVAGEAGVFRWEQPPEVVIAERVVPRLIGVEALAAGGDGSERRSAATRGSGSAPTGAGVSVATSMCGGETVKDTTVQRDGPHVIGRTPPKLSPLRPACVSQRSRLPGAARKGEAPEASGGVRSAGRPRGRAHRGFV